MKIKEGSITIFMAMILSVLVALICSSLLSARNAAARVQILCGMDVGLYSLMAGYEKRLLEEYDVFFLDGGYGTENLDAAKIDDVFQKYMKPVLKQNYQKLQVKNVGISGYTLATDGQGTPFYKQTVAYMKQSLGVTVLQGLLSKIQPEAEKSQDALTVWKSAGEDQSLGSYENEIRQAQESQKQSEEKNQDTSDTDEIFETEAEQTKELVVVDNPLPTILQIRKRGLLGIVVPYNKNISGKKISLFDTLAYRKKNVGLGDNGLTFSSNAADKVLFHEYILRKMGNFLEPSDRELDYEAEYILMGYDSDQENLKGTISNLFLVREGLNLTYLLTNNVRMAEAGGLAAAISSSFLFPPAAGVIQTAIILCWSFAESVLDTRILLSGGEVPAWKTDLTWNVSLENIVNILNIWDCKQENMENGLDYQEYLRILFFLKDESKVCIRCMDMIESEMHRNGRKNFKWDNCIIACEMWMDVEANGLKTYTITRKYSYLQEN